MKLFNFFRHKKEVPKAISYPIIFYQFQDGSCIDELQFSLNKALNKNYNLTIQAKGKIICKFKVYRK